MDTEVLFGVHCRPFFFIFFFEQLFRTCCSNTTMEGHCAGRGGMNRRRRRKDGNDYLSNEDKWLLEDSRRAPAAESFGRGASCYGPPFPVVLTFLFFFFFFGGGGGLFCFNDVDVPECVF